MDDPRHTDTTIVLGSRVIRDHSRCPRSVRVVLALLALGVAALLAASLDTGEPPRALAATQPVGSPPPRNSEPRVMAIHQVAQPPMPRPPRDRPTAGDSPDR